MSLSESRARTGMFCVLSQIAAAVRSARGGSTGAGGGGGGGGAGGEKRVLYGCPGGHFPCWEKNKRPPTGAKGGIPSSRPSNNAA